MGLFDFDGDAMDMCDDCQVNPAIVHLTHIEDGESQTFHLCEDCARKRGIPFPDGEALIKGLEALAAGAGAALGNTHVKLTLKQADAPPAKAIRQEDRREEDVECRGCGLRLSEFRMSGRLGCAECYASFEEQIDKMLVQLHGAGGHSGKRYGRAGARVGVKKNLERLRKDLDSAIKNEDFERAVVIRDAMRGLEQGVR